MMTLRILLIIHAVATFAAGAVLVVAPAAIPRVVGVHVGTDAYLICYLLAAAEFGLAVMSWGARTITDDRALRVIVTTIIVVHAASGILEVYAFVGGVSSAIWGNVVFRALVVSLFAYFGLRRSA
jgi:hypothetical protein